VRGGRNVFLSCSPCLWAGYSAGGVEGTLGRNAIAQRVEVVGVFLGPASEIWAIGRELGAPGAYVGLRSAYLYFW